MPTIAACFAECRSLPRWRQISKQRWFPSQGVCLGVEWQGSAWGHEGVKIKNPRIVTGAFSHQREAGCGRIEDAFRRFFGWKGWSLFVYIFGSGVPLSWYHPNTSRCIPAARAWVGGWALASKRRATSQSCLCSTSLIKWRRLPCIQVLSRNDHPPHTHKHTLMLSQKRRPHSVQGFTIFLNFFSWIFFLILLLTFAPQLCSFHPQPTNRTKRKATLKHVFISWCYFLNVSNTGGKHCLALTTEGCVYSWGCGDEGKLGHGSRADCLSPRKMEVRAFYVSCW